MPRRPGIAAAALAILAGAAVAVSAFAGGPVPARTATPLRPAGQAALAPDGNRTDTATLGRQLTRWRTIGYWGHPKHLAAIRTGPSLHSPVVTHVHFRTEDGYPEVYLVLRKLRARSGKTWLKLAIPMRPNGTTGWALRGALGRLHRVRRWLVIDRTSLAARFYLEGRPIWRAPVGVGKPSTPTPDGLFWVREEFVLPDQPFYGPYAFGTSAYANISEWPGGGVVGLHGTSLPSLVPGRPSHGCIRLRNEDILWLARHLPVGTPVAIIR